MYTKPLRLSLWLRSGHSTRRKKACHERAALAVSRMAERGGFEPPVQALDPYNGLANRRLQPLGHLSTTRYLLNSP